MSAAEVVTTIGAGAALVLAVWLAFNGGQR